jgi:peptidoglycan hydrolase FlgJ
MTIIVTPAEAGVSAIQSTQPGSGPGLRLGDRVTQTAKQFEAIFLRQMIASMRAPSIGDDLFGSDASNQFRDMSDARLADNMAGSFGIAAMLEKQIAK